MSEIFLVARHVLNWRFVFIISFLLIVGLKLPDKFSKPFRSVRFNIWLFVVIAAASSLGTFYPQTGPFDSSNPNYGPILTPLFEGLGFFDLYHTWWFSALLALMAFDVVVCKLKVGPSAPLGETRERRFEDENDLIHQVKIAPLKTLIESPMNSTLVVRATRDWLLKEGLRFKEVFHSLKAENRAGTLFIAGRHGFQRWGDFFLHISIVVILAGSLLGAMFGFEEILPIAEGETVQMKNRPYEVTLDDFDIEYYRSTGAPSLYASKITVKEKGAVIGRKRIIVNDPLDIDRVRFYQASWGMTTEFRSATLVLAGREFHLGPKNIVQIPGTTLSVRANQFLPSFDINELGQPVTMDYQGVNPAVQMDFFKDNRLQVRLWLLKRNPEMSLRFREGRLEKTSPPPFRLMEVDPVLFSGIQVGYDPGAPVFWLGSITLLIGLGVHFYFHQRRIKILILPDKTRSMIWVGGWNSRTPEDFQNEFKKWTSDLKKLVL